MSLLTELDAFFTDHMRCGELEAGIDGPVVWFDCECGVSMARRTDDNPATDDARGRRRSELAAVLVRDNAPELRLVRDWLDSWSGLGLIIAGMTHRGRAV